MLKEKIAKSIADISGLEMGVVISKLEVPPDQKLGDFAFPCFILSKILRKSPPLIAEELSSKIKLDDIISKPNGPYLNFFIDNKVFVENILSKVLDEKENYGKEDSKNKTIVVDYAAPNVAKNMGIHNLRSTIIGQALCNSYKFLGYKVIGINHLGDWGTQFGKLIWALEKWSSPEELSKKGIVYLNEMYVKYHSEIEKEGVDSDLMEEEARAWFKKIEDGDERAKMWWGLLVDISMADYNEIFRRLGVKFDYVIGESFYMQFLDETISTLEKAGLTSISEGALVVDFHDDNMPPCLLKKSDGATLYGTRDISAIMYRLKEYVPDKILYVVDIAQSLHFQQVFRVMTMLDKSNKEKLEHIQFGRLSFLDGSMSTRKGNIVPLREVLDKSKEKVLEIIKKKNPGLKNKDEVSEIVGTGAIIFGDLFNDRVHNIVFEWDKVLDFQGETAPYVQYSIARINSIIRKAGYELIPKVDYAKISTDDDKKLVKLMGDFNSAVNAVISGNKPHHIGKYVVSLAQEFNNYYSKNKIVQSEDKSLQDSRLALIFGVKEVLVSGLNLLGVRAPEEM